MSDSVEELERQIKCVRRELAFRRNVYPKFIAKGTMKQEEADRERAAMQSVLDTLIGLQECPACMGSRWRIFTEAYENGLSEKVVKACPKCNAEANLAPPMVPPAWKEE